MLLGNQVGYSRRHTRGIQRRSKEHRPFHQHTISSGFPWMSRKGGLSAETWMEILFVKGWHCADYSVNPKPISRRALRKAVSRLAGMMRVLSSSWRAIFPALGSASTCVASSAERT